MSVQSMSKVWELENISCLTIRPWAKKSLFPFRDESYWSQNQPKLHQTCRIFWWFQSMNSWRWLCAIWFCQFVLVVANNSPCNIEALWGQDHRLGWVNERVHQSIGESVQDGCRVSPKAKITVHHLEWAWIVQFLYFFNHIRYHYGIMLDNLPHK